MSSLAHVWGDSPGADRVMAEVAGMAPSHAKGRLFMILQAFVDETFGTDGVFVIGGHVASAEKWAVFSKHWENMLPTQGLRDANGPYFKMSEMALSPERMSRVPGFYRLIENAVAASVTVRFNVHDLEAAKARAFIPGVAIDWGYTDNPWMFGFRALVDMFHSPKVRGDLSPFIPTDAAVDFYFDDRAEKKAIRKSWDLYLAERGEEALKRFGKEPRFEDDRVFLPLQAADLWIWWVRKWQSDGTIDQKMLKPEFDGWSAKREEHPRLDIWFDEDDLFRALVSLFLSGAQPPGLKVYDKKGLIVFPQSGAGR